MGKRVDFTTTEERINWLKTTAAKQEISVSQLLNRLIRNRMKNEEKFFKKSTIMDDESHPKKIFNKEELLRELYEEDEQ